MGKVIFRPNPPSDAKRPPPRQRVELLLGLPGGGSPWGSSRWKTLFRCPREYGLAYEAGIRANREWEQLTLGLAFHSFLDAYYGVFRDHHAHLLAADYGARDAYFWWACTERAEAAGWDAIRPIAKANGYDETWKVLERICQAYLTQYRNADEWTVLATEETLEWHGEDAEGAPKYSARIDLIIEKGGLLWDVEHKSARAITKDLVEGYQLDLQVLGQAWLIKQVLDFDEYPPFGGVMVNITTKHMTPQFQRIEVCPSPQHLMRFEKTARQYNALLPVYREAGWPAALGACAGFARGYTQCAYFDLCHRTPHLEPEEMVVHNALGNDYRVDATDSVAEDDI